MTERVAIDALEALVLKAMRNIGYENHEARLLTQIMMHAEVHGNNQGISKLYDVNAPGGLAFNATAGPLRVERTTQTSAVVNGNQRTGMAALSKAVELAVSKAKGDAGMAVVGTYNTSTSTGMLAYYAEQVASHDLIAIVLAQSPELVAPKGGTRAVFGTNPLCIAVPGPPEGPVVLDMATAAMTLFGAVTAKANGTQLPEGVAVGRDGQPTTDPAEALAGALLTFGGPSSNHKSSGLSLIVELLGGVLPGGHPPGEAVTKKQAKNWANLIIAVDPSLLTDIQAFKDRVTRVCRYVKSTGEVHLPGEREKERYRTNVANGYLDISAALLGRIRELAALRSRL